MAIKILQCAPGDCTNIDFLTFPLLKKFFENNFLFRKEMEM